MSERFRRWRQESTLFRLMDVWIAVLVLMLILFWLTGCAPVKVREVCTPPAVLLEPRPVPVWLADGTFRDLLAYTVQLQKAALASETDKALVREYINEACQ